ncbi:MAG: AgmX/PglI C-terminal domain-containing protein [Polyangia bacterium]
MKFVCDRCQTKYSIADDKVRGKILKVRCKSCANIITVREEGARKPSSPVIPVGGAAPPTGSAPRATIVAPRLPTPPPSPPLERRAAARPPAPPVDDGVVWYMALDGNRTGPFSRKQLIDQVAPLPKDADIHVWNERLGSWKPPMDVPALANEIHARRRPPVPVPPMPPMPAAPPAPPPFPGAPRRPTGTSFPVAAAPAAGAPARPTGSHGIVPAPVSPGLGAKLPPPVGGRRSPSGVFPRPGALAASAAAPASAEEPDIDMSFGEPEPAAPARGAEARRAGTGTSHPALDSSSLLETPAPVPAMLHGLATNGVSHADSSDARAAVGTNGASHGDNSDGLNVLNLSAGASGVAAAPRLMSPDSVVGWQPSAGEPGAARQKTTRFIVAVMGIVGFSVAVLMFTMMKKPKPVTPPPPPKAATTDPLAAVVENPNLAPAAPVPAPIAPAARAPEPAPSSSHRSHGHGAHGRGAPVAPPPSTTPPPAAPPAAAAGDDANSKYRDSHNLNITAGPSTSRPPPSQGEISRVINNNRGGIKNCYQRALLRDNSLTHGKITVKVSIGISGRVKHTAVEGPPQFRAIDPCIREVVGRWAFPPAGEEYGTEFVYVFQGNE